MQSIQLHINGMTCGGCAAGLKRALSESPDVLSAEVNFATEEAKITTTETVAASDWVQRVRKAGFSVLSDTHRFVWAAPIDVPTSADLTELLAYPEVVDWHWHPGLKTLDVTTLADAELEALNHALIDAGFSEPVPETDARPSQTHRETWELWLAIALTLPLVAQMGSMWFGLGWHLPPMAEWLLATPIQFWMGRRFYQGAWSALKRREANMDTLVALGTSVAYGYSVAQWALLGNAATGTLYFEAAAVVITLVLVGKTIEHRAKHSATAALQALLALKPDTVRVLKQGQETLISASALRTGDVIVVRAGERIGADGVILKGEAEVDAQAMTGEPLPELKQVGDPALSGTLVVNGQIRIRAERVGAASAVSQVADLVKNAQMGEAPIQKLVDQVSRRFVPAVMGIALLTWIGWSLAGASVDFALMAAISVLVIACPCALGLATPTALVAGTGLAARAGILIKDIQTLEALPSMTVLCFDKTGTLTEGQPEVTAQHVQSGSEDGFVDRLVSVARESTHPLAEAVVRAFPERGLPDWQVVSSDNQPGQGIEVTTDRHRYRFGQWSFVDPTGGQPRGEDTESALSEDGQVLGSVAFQDRLRPESAEVMGALKEEGLQTHMLTGDRASVANPLGAALGLDQVTAGLSPDDKIAHIQALKAQGEIVGMVGDGINDGPALAAAHVGIALGSGSDIALQSAPVVLMRPDLQLVLDAIAYARKTRRIIRQNLIWAFGYNVLCIPLAISGVLTPAIAGFAMALSSVSVVANALRLKYQRVR